MAKIEDITPKDFKIIPYKDKVLAFEGESDPSQGVGAQVGGLGGSTVTEVNDTIDKVDNTINDSNQVITDLINARIDTSAKTILADFAFGVSGALQIGEYVAGVSGDIRISPNGIIGRNSDGDNTFTLNGTTGAATFAGELTAAHGTLGAITIGTNAWHVDLDGNMWWGEYASYADAIIKISATGVANLSGLVVGTNVGLGTAQDSTGVTTIIDNTITTGYINALSVVAGSVACENLTGTIITGKTITGGIVQTASSGIRTVLNSSDDKIKFMNNAVVYASLYPYVYPQGLGVMLETTSGDSGTQLVLQEGSIDTAGLTVNQKGIWVNVSGDLDVYRNITVAGTVDGVDISTHAGNVNAHHAQSHAHSSHSGIGASDHHSSTSNGLAITPSSVNTTYIHIGDVNAYDILPYGNNYGSIGYNARRWDNGYFNKLYCSQQTANKFITGDLNFRHNEKVVFSIDENPDYLNFYNKDNQLVMKLSKDGDILLKGKVKQL